MLFFIPPPHVYLSLQLKSPWQRFQSSLSKILPHTHALIQRCHSRQLPACLHVCIESIRLSPYDSVVMSSLCLFSCLPFLFVLFSICRFCTAAADRKLRLLTSDLQDKHEIKVTSGAHWPQVFLSVGIRFSLLSTDIWHLMVQGM